MQLSLRINAYMRAIVITNVFGNTTKFVNSYIVNSISRIRGMLWIIHYELLYRFSILRICNLGLNKNQLVIAQCINV
jgi:hypothetical protein